MCTQYIGCTIPDTMFALGPVLRTRLREPRVQYCTRMRLELRRQTPRDDGIEGLPFRYYEIRCWSHSGTTMLSMFRDFACQAYPFCLSMSFLWLYRQLNFCGDSPLSLVANPFCLFICKLRARLTKRCTL